MTSYFKKAIIILFLDHLISAISARFTAHSKACFKSRSILKCHFYYDDLPIPIIVDEEFCRWKSKWLLVPKDDHPDTTVKFLKESLTFLNFLHLPLSSSSC